MGSVTVHVYVEATTVFVDFQDSLSGSMKIAVEGCCHGELDKIYETIDYLEKKEGVKVDLLLCCGDFQAVRNEGDMKCMAVPPKYRSMQSFYKSVLYFIFVQFVKSSMDHDIDVVLAVVGTTLERRRLPFLQSSLEEIMRLPTTCKSLRMEAGWHQTFII